VEPVLVPPPTKGHISVARLSRNWYVACRSGELGKKPIARQILGTPLTLFRDSTGAPRALLDRCPHRNVPLSLGRVTPQGTSSARITAGSSTGRGSAGACPA
jgi:hypothetical protein